MMAANEPRFQVDEESPLNGLEQEILSKEYVSNSRKYPHYVGMAIISVALLFVALNAYDVNPLTLNAGLTQFAGSKSKETSYTISVKVSSGEYDQLSSLSYLPWDVIVEPYRDQLFSIDSFEIDDETITIDSDNYDVSWSIDGQTYTDLSPTVVVKDTGVMDATVTITPKSTSKHYGTKTLSGLSRTTSKQKIYRQLHHNDMTPFTSSSYELSFTMAVKYVRREIRTMSDADRTAFFGTLQQLYVVDDTNGQDLYGTKYHSAEYFAAQHLLGGARTDCDHFHDGGGVATAHVSMTLSFEQSLQSINPAIALPYWEYTKDNYLYSSSEDSIVWSKDWFGEMSSDNGFHTLNDNSFWANVTLPSGESYESWDISTTGSLNPYINAYKQLRSPWNNNISPNILRENTMYYPTGNSYSEYPTCSTLYTAFDSAALALLNTFLNGNTHGPTHIYIGGAWVNDDSIDDYTDIQSSSKVLLFKMLWRMGYTRCPTDCTPGDTCSCAVPQEYIDKFGAKYILDDIGAIDTLGLENDGDDEYFEGYLLALQDAGNVGEMFSSNAAYDPIFWSVHGTMERLLSLKRILSQQGDIDFDEDWGYATAGFGDIYLSGVCDWSAVSSVTDLTLPTCNTTASCYGHSEDDILPYGNFLGDGKSYTNSEFYDFINPWSDDLPYVFDTYTYDYCNEYDNIDFLEGITDELVYKGFKRGNKKTVK